MPAIYIVVSAVSNVTRFISYLFYKFGYKINNLKTILDTTTDIVKYQVVSSFFTNKFNKRKVIKLTKEL